MQPAKVIIRGNCSVLQNLDEGLSICFYDDLFTDEIECLIFSGPLPSFSVLPPLAFGQSGKRVFPSPLSNSGITSGEIRFCYLQVQHWLAFSLVLCLGLNSICAQRWRRE